MKIPDIIKETGRKLRKNMTKSEVILWGFIKDWKLWVRFLRQKPLYVFTEYNWHDRYIIPDFYCHTKKIILEIDWNIHDLKEVYELDKYKEELLKNMWYKVLRIKNEEIYSDIYTVVKKIKQNL